MRIYNFKFLLDSAKLLLTPLLTSDIIISILRRNKMEKSKVKKVVKTKATLVAELEQVIKVDKGFLNSLERANAETIKKLINICS